MKNIVIITPVYNDWESFSKLIKEIDKAISSFKDISFKLIAVNDGSKEKSPLLKLPPGLKKIEIINMRINQGHAICLANGIRYALKNYEFDNLILMDADGEDRPEEIFDLINKAKDLKNLSVVAKRVKRSEGSIFKLFYILHKILTLIFTGKLINFGNYSLIMSVFIRSALFLVLLSYLQPFIGSGSLIFQLFIVIFNILIYLVSTKSNENKLNKMDIELKDTENITQ